MTTPLSPRPFQDLEGDFSAACDEAVEECKTLGYPPTIWIPMSKGLGAAEAARRLLVSGDIQSGFERLIALGRHSLHSGIRSSASNTEEQRGGDCDKQV